MDEVHVSEEKTDNATNNIKRNKSVLDNFSRLTKNSVKIRTKAGVNLVKYLLEEGEVDAELKYALGRIVRGLGSSKVDTRCGFYSALVPLLNFSNISIGQIFECVDKELHTVKSNSKSENADIFMGKILICGAIIRSELFTKSLMEERVKVLQCLIDSGKVRSYLSYPSFCIILDLVKSINEEEFSTLVLPVVLPELQKPWSEYNLDTLYLLIQLRTTHPKIVEKKVLKKIFGTTELITESNLQDLTSILLNIPRITALHHPVYEAFVNIFVETGFTTIFVSYIDGILLKYNRNKHLVIINIITLLLAHTKEPNEVPLFLTENLIQQTFTIFRQLKGAENDSEIKQRTHKLFNSVLETLKRAKEKTKIAVLKKLLLFPGTLNFEKITQSKLVQQITGILQAEGVKKLSKLYREVITLRHENSNAETFQNNDRLYAAHLLVKLIAHPTVHDENDWKCEQLKFIMRLGLFKQDKVGVELAVSLKDTFYRSLDMKLSKLDELSRILRDIFNELDSSLSEDNLESALRSPVTSDVYATWCKARDLINKIESKKTKKVKLVFQVLFLHLGLQLFNDVKLAQDSLEELFICYEKTKKSKHAENANDPAWIEVVVELFLSLLSRNSYLLRKIINCVFPHLCEYLNATSIHQILSILDPKNEDNPLLNGNDDSDDEGVNSDEESEASDASEDNDEEEDEESNEEMSEEDEDMEESNTDKLRRALHTALMQNADNNDDESDIDLDQLNEEQGEKLNKVLGEVFKQFKPKIGKSKKQNKSDEALTHFRVRVLDLIEIYLDSNPSMILALEIMLPLLQTLEFSIKDDHQKPLQVRLKSCLKKLTNLKKFDDVLDVNDKILYDLLESLLQKGTKNAVLMQFMGEVLAQCCTFLIRCSQILTNSEHKQGKTFNQDFVDILTNSLHIYLKTRDCHIPFALFKHILQMTWIGNVEIANKIITVIFDEDIKPFRKSHGIQLLKIFYSNHRLLSTLNDKMKTKTTRITHQFLEKCLQFLIGLMENHSDKNIREKVVSYLFHLITIIKHGPIDHQDFNWERFGEVIRECRSSFNLNQDTKKSFNKLCSTLGVSNVVKTKLKQTIGNNNSTVASTISEKKKNKQNISNDKLKLKKETKLKRMKSLSSGLEGGFSQVENVYEMDIENLAINSESEGSKKSKRISNGNATEDIFSEGETLNPEKTLSKKKKRRITDSTMENSKKKNKT